MNRGAQKWRFVPPLLVVLVVVLGAGIAVAAIPDADGEISGCYHDTTGSLRVIDAEEGETCRPQETLLEWNQEGPEGPQGPAGEDGVTPELYRVVEEEGPSQANNKRADADCEPGDKVAGGGYEIVSEDVDDQTLATHVNVVDNHPRGNQLVGWRVRALEFPDVNGLGSGVEWTLRVSATCQDLTP